MKKISTKRCYFVFPGKSTETEFTALVFAHCVPYDPHFAWLSCLQFVWHSWERYSSSRAHWRELRCRDSSDGIAAANGHFSCLEAPISRTTLKIHCIMCSLNIDMLNQHDVTLVRNSLATRGDMQKIFKAANHVVHVQERDCFQCKSCISASHTVWRLMVLKPLSLIFLSLLRISRSKKTKYHSFRLTAHFKQTCCEGRIFHHDHADHKIGDWM